MQALEGDLATLPLPLTLLRVAGQGVTGILTVQGENDIIAVSFLRGRIVSADALNQTVEEGLGEILVAEGLTNRAVFEGLAAEHQGAGGTLSELLVERGVVSREQLLEALRLQTYRLMLHLLGWKQGEFKFYSGDEVSYEQGFTPIPVEELLVRAREEPALDGEPGVAPDPALSYSAKPADRVVRVLDQDGEGVGPGLWLTADEVRLWQALDGRKSALEAVPQLDRYQIQHALYRLRDLDLVEVVDLDATGSRQVGAAEIFMPPDPAAAPVAPTVEVEPVVAADDVRWPAWIAQGLAALAFGLLLAVLIARPTAILLPFPWQGEQRLAFERQLRQSLFQRIDQSARVFYLMESRFPNHLVEMLDLGMISTRELREPSGRTLAYRVEDGRYVLALQGGDESAFDARLTETAGSDFLLEPERQVRADSGEAPLYLID